MDAPRRYLEELRGELGFYPMWMPADSIALGTFGTFDRGVFRKEGRLGDLGIDFAVETPDAKSSFKKQRGMRFGASSSTSAEASVIDASAGVTVSVDSAYSWAFGAVGARKAEIADVLQVQSAILAARRTGLWKDEYLLVSEVYEVDTLNVLIATSKNASGEIKAKGKIQTAEHILLAQDASFRFDASDVFVVDNAERTTPLYGLRKVRGFFSKGLAPISGGDPAAKEPTLERTTDASMFP
jgi:hypothetical protein